MTCVIRELPHKLVLSTLIPPLFPYQGSKRLPTMTYARNTTDETRILPVTGSHESSRNTVLGIPEQTENQVEIPHNVINDLRRTQRHLQGQKRHSVTHVINEKHA